jgi:hypothetical protein
VLASAYALHAWVAVQWGRSGAFDTVGDLWHELVLALLVVAMLMIPSCNLLTSARKQDCNGNPPHASIKHTYGNDWFSVNTSVYRLPRSKYLCSRETHWVQNEWLYIPAQGTQPPECAGTCTSSIIWCTRHQTQVGNKLKLCNPPN